MFYRIATAAVTSAAVAETVAPIVYVPPFAASGLHGERAVVYAHADGTALEQYPYDYWIDSPRILLQQALLSALRAEGRVRAVSEPTSEAAFTTRVRLIDFERRATTGENGAAMLTLEFALQGESMALPVFERQYTRTLALSADTVPAAVGALSQAVREVTEEIARDIGAHVSPATAR
jgi:ABC-type uncharacterized transport system auxiliary subunit